MSHPESVQELLDHLGRIADLNAAAAVLDWDQETYMPAGGAEARAHQVATIREMAHNLLVSDETLELLERAKISDLSPDFTQPLVRTTSRDLERERKIPAQLVSEMALAGSRAREGWKHAREQDDFSHFAPHLERILELVLRKAEAIGYETDPYDALIDEFEPDMKASTVKQVFDELRQKLIPTINEISDGVQVDDSFLYRQFDASRQWSFGLEAARSIGYNFERGRQDLSAHPFTTTFSISDVRITTRINEDYFPSGFFGTLHEAGHALYEQGIDPRFDRTPLAEGTSLAMHESQSRFWENQIGRSRAYWQRNFQRLAKTFPDALMDVDVEGFYRGINRVEPSLIRVEADEVTYNLHVMLRFEIETDLVAGRLKPNDVPEAWAELTSEYLGIRPDNHRNGALQDIHWSLGAIGYFPTYALGTIISSQLAEAAEAELGPLHDLIENDQLLDVREWLRTRVHRWGRARSATEILQDVTGGGIDARAWLRYIDSKYGQIYDL